MSDDDLKRPSVGCRGGDVAVHLLRGADAGRIFRPLAQGNGAAVRYCAATNAHGAPRGCNLRRGLVPAGGSTMSPPASLGGSTRPQRTGTSVPATGGGRRGRT